MVDRQKIQRPLRPIVLIVAGTWLLVGCVWIPVFEKPIDHTTDYSKRVGNRGSKRPIRLKVSHRDDVVRVLGPPRYTSPDGATFAYSWRVINGYFIWPLCFPLSLPHGEAPVTAQQGNRTLILSFDQRGFLNGWRVTGNNGDSLYGTVGFPPAPAGMVPYDTTSTDHYAAPASRPSPPRPSSNDSIDR